MRNRKGYERLPTDEKSASESEKSVPKKKKFLQRIPDWLPEQFKGQEIPIPWKSIGYATFLFVFGTILLLIGCLIHTGHVEEHVGHQNYNDRLWPMIIFGSLMFIPGSYHVFLAIQTFRGVPGYLFDEYPTFD